MKTTPEFIDIPTFTINDFIPNVNGKKDMANFYVSNIDEYVANDSMLNTPIKLDHFSIGLLMQGSGKVLLNMISYHLKRNSLFILTPNKYITFEGHSADSKMLIISFTQDFLIKSGMNRRKSEIFNYAEWYNYPHFYLSETEVKILRTIMSSMRENYVSEEILLYKKEVLYHGFNVFLFQLASILSKYRIHTSINLTRKEDIFRVFSELLIVHFKEERSVQYYAGIMCITSSHLSKTIKELTNKPCSELIDAMVIVEAKILLDDISLSILNVSELLHFSDQFFFSKFFKSNTGINPSQYKNRA